MISFYLLGEHNAVYRFYDAIDQQLITDPDAIVNCEKKINPQNHAGLHFDEIKFLKELKCVSSFKRTTRRDISDNMLRV